MALNNKIADSLSFFAAMVALLGSFHALAVPTEPQKISINVGEIRGIELAEARELHVSRQGVIQLRHREGQSWELIGLRSGVVVVDAGKWHMLIEVKPRDLGTKFRRSTKSGSLSPDICEGFDVDCQETGIVTGLINDSAAWMALKKLCKSKLVEPTAEISLPCTFDVELSKAGIENLTEQWSAILGSRFAVHFQGQRALIMAPCSTDLKNGGDEGSKLKTLADSLLSGAISDGAATFVCVEDYFQSSFGVQAFVSLVERGEADQLGIELGIGGGLTSFSALQTTAGLQSHWQGLLKHARTLAAPVFNLISGTEATAHSGGELHLYSQDPLAPGNTGETKTSQNDLPSSSANRQAAYWKEIGVRLRVKLTSSPHNFRQLPAPSRLAYDLQVRNVMRSGESPQLSTNQLTGNLEFSGDQPVLAAIIQVAGHSESGIGPRFLGGLPIVGPLFTRSESENTNALLMLWFRVLAAPTPGPHFPAAHFQKELPEAALH